MTNAVYINAISTVLPGAPVDNDSIENVLGMVAGKPSRAKKIILRSNGIKSRYYAIDPVTRRATHNNATLTAEAVRGLAKFGLNPDNIDLLACGTSMPDQIMPGAAPMLHGALKNPACEVVSLAGICLSGVMALKYAWLAVGGGDKRCAVVTAAENASAIMRGESFQAEIEEKIARLESRPELQFDKDFLRFMLSDGAAATWLSPLPTERGLALKIEWIEQRSYAHLMPPCMYAGGEMENGRFRGWREYLPEGWAARGIFAVKQDVKLLNEHIVPLTVEQPLTELLAAGRFSPQEIDYFLPHYSSEFFRDRLYQGMKKVGCDISQNKWFTNLAYKGNTGSASIFIILEELLSGGALRPGEKILCYVPESGRFSSAFILASVV
ncbi:MAG: beta-ketoacyl-ACP synthase III [Desulfobulbaceae bacterium]|jgi:3-oxoacyl-[acyl-carrier-protein] synthase-3|nr:beta-ketoacyl-ACP synthase III [Desulfobulbaceae bacterium]